MGHLTAASIDDAPGCCVGCTWWQTRSGSRAVDKARWADAVEERFGTWGKLYVDGGRTLCLLQYGPADTFPHARDLPAGPPGDDAVLITCAFLVDPSSPWALQSLLLAAIGETRDAGRPAIEAFAYRYDEGEAYAARFLQHRTVFPRAFLSDLGFRTVRAQGRVELMRLDVRGIVPVEEPGEGLVAAALRLWQERRAAAPA